MTKCYDWPLCGHRGAEACEAEALAQGGIKAPAVLPAPPGAVPLALAERVAMSDSAFSARLPNGFVLKYAPAANLPRRHAEFRALTPSCTGGFAGQPVRTISQDLQDVVDEAHALLTDAEASTDPDRRERFRLARRALLERMEAEGLR